MKATSAYINFMLGYGNDPELVIKVENIPGRGDLLYEQRGPCYFAEKDGYVNFFGYRGPGDGYGGAEFTLSMEDGSTKVLEGPWSSRCGVMNKMGFQPSLEVTLRQQGKNFNTGGAVTIWYAGQVIREHIEVGFMLSGIDRRGEKRFEISWAIPIHTGAGTDMIYVGNDIPEEVQIKHTHATGQMSIEQIAERTRKDVAEVRAIIDDDLQERVRDHS